MTRKKIITNTKMIHDYMEYSSPLNQVFVIQAMNNLAKIVIEQRKDLIAKMKDSMISPHAWIQCAEEWQKAYRKQQEVNQ